MSPTLTFGSNFVTATVAVSSNFRPTMRITHILSATFAVGSNFRPTMRITHILSATVTIGSNFEESLSPRDGRKLRRATQSSSESFPRPCSQASAFSSYHKSDIKTVTAQADKIIRWIERTNPRFDSAKSRFERTIPKFDNEVVKT